MNRTIIVESLANDVVGMESDHIFCNSPTAEGAMKALAHMAHMARITAVNFMV